MRYLLIAIIAALGVIAAPVDINPEIAPAGVLLPEYTTDGVHLTEAAYEIWKARLDL